NPQSGSCLTDNYGSCQFNYQGNNTGTDTITASATIDGYAETDTVSALWLGPPPNDNFADAIPASPLPYSDQQYIIAATKETSEPNPCGGVSYTEWYRYTPA